MAKSIIDQIKGTFEGWTLRTVSWTLVFVFLILQALGIVFKNYITINLGPLVLFALILVTVVIAASIAKNQMQGIPIRREDFYALLILTALSVLGAIYLRDILPEVFSMSLNELRNSIQSILPLP